MKIITKIYISIGFILLTFLFVTVMHRLQSQEVEQEIEDVLYITEKLKLSETLQKHNLDMETGLRGFLLSDRKSFLEPYYEGSQAFDVAHQELLQLEKNTEQRQRLLQIDSLKNAWTHNFADTLIAAKKIDMVSDAPTTTYDLLFATLVKAGRGKQLTDQVRDHFDQYNNFEIKQKQQQLTELRKKSKLTNVLAVVLTILAILIGVITAVLLGRIIRKRLKQMISMADHIAEGEFGTRLTDQEEDEISRLSQSLNVMAGRLDTSFSNLNKMNRELDQFAYVVSHDLKAPLRAINNLAEWIEEDLPEADADIKEKLTLMRGRVLRMENLINGILEYSKIGRKEIAPATVNVKQLVAEIVDSLAPPAHFTVTLPENAPTFTTEKILLQQVFTNLISNAIKYNPNPEPTITITSQEAGNAYRFGVADNGPGIPKQFHDKIFGIFQTLLSRDTRESTGVGLSIVQKIVTEKNGKVWIESEPGNGATFYFTWPKN